MEFLPRAPDPEEIIFEGTDAETGPEFEKNEKNVSESDGSKNEGDKAEASAEATND